MITRPFRIPITVVVLLCAMLAASGPAMAAPRTPQLLTPGRDARTQQVPTFTWKAVRGAVRYEFQLAADDNFGSIVDRGSFSTRNTAATLTKSIPDGEYFWRVRGINGKDRAGAWSVKRPFTKEWTTAPQLLGPATDTSVLFPTQPLVLRWSSVARAYKYRVYVATDPGLGTLVVGNGKEPFETSGTVFSPGNSLAPGRYYWAVEARDASGHRGRRSAVGSFVWSWPTATSTFETDLNDDARVHDPRFSWNPVDGAVAYELEVNHSEDFAVGSKVCCSGLITGTSHSPADLLPNNFYYWRVRALDADGNAGQWNHGPTFDKNFGNYRGLAGIPPTVQDVTLRDHDSEAATDLVPGGVVNTDAPIFTWSAVPGASHYQTELVPRVVSGCDWTHPVQVDETATLAWTPLAPVWHNEKPDPSYPSPAVSGPALVDGQDYCFRVRARTKDSDIYSEWSQYPSTGTTAAFTYEAFAPTTVGTQLTMSDADYLGPAKSSTWTRLPLFTWKRIPGAHAYWVVVSKDQLFTNIVDVALTNIPAYAPRKSGTPKTYQDDDTPLYWVVLPAHQADGGLVDSQPPENFERSFLKNSTPPQLLTPASGSDVSDQPVFRWAWTEGARDYRLQVSQDPTFSDPIEDVVTTSTSYTSVRFYPADTVLYWRVRVNDATNIGLRWSPAATFRRRLPAPLPSLGNPTGGPFIPALTWTPVQGAASYDVHAVQSDGTIKDFTVRGTAFTPTIFYGTGVWHWQVRANFVRSGQTVKSGYFAPQPFTRRIPAPGGANAVNRGDRLVFAWEPNGMVKQYRLQISSTNSFGSIIEDVRTENLSYAPNLTKQGFIDGGRLYWRIASIDEGGNTGAWTVRKLRTAARMVVKTSGSLARGQRGRVVITATDAKGRAIRKARVSVSGAASALARTGRRGTAAVSLRPRGGMVKIRVSKTGYRPAVVSIAVR